MSKKQSRCKPKPGTFAETFLRKIDRIEAVAIKKGSNLATVCKHAKISRAGPHRWRRRVPATIAIVDRLSVAAANMPSRKK